MLALPTLLVLCLAPPPGGAVELEGGHALALRDAARDPGGAPAGPAALERTVTITHTKDGTRMLVRWRIAAGTPGWFAGRLVGGDVVVRRVSVDGRPAAAASESPTTHVLLRVDREAVLELDAIVKGDPSRAPIELGLLPAVRGTVAIVGAPSWRVDATDGSATFRSDGRTYSGAGELRIAAAPPPATEGERLAIGRVGIGVLVGEAEIRGRARAQWVLRRGELDRVSFTAKGAGDDLKVEGPEVLEVDRSGERVTVSLKTPQRGTVALELSWTQTTPKGDAVLTPPELVLDDVGRTEVTLEVGRDGDVDVLPELDGWRAIAPQELPGWGRDLIEGTPTAVFTRHAAADPGRLQLLRFVPVEAPPVVVQNARFTVVAAEHGASLLQARYEVVNERASHLRVTLPARARLLAVEVGGEEQRPGRDGEVVLVPIKRSLETIEGLISTPVVVTVLLDDRRWRRREQRDFPLVAVDAPIRKTTATVVLPRDVIATVDEGEAGVVSVQHAARRRERSTRRRGLDGSAMGVVQTKRWGRKPEVAPTTAAPALDDSLREAEADRLLEEATDLYNQNEFDAAQQKLDELEKDGKASEDARRLQSNLDVVNAPADIPVADEVGMGGVAGRDSAGIVDTTASAPKPAPIAERMASGKMGVFRRVKEQARARASKQIVEQRERKKNAQQLRARGDYKAAEEEYRKAQEVSRKLKKLEQDEDKTYDFEDDAIEGEIEATKSEAAAKDYADSASKTKLVDPALFDPDGEHAFGAADAWLPPITSRGVAAVTAEPPRPIGPRVLLPTNGGDVVHYSFDLWAPGSRHALSIRARKRVRLPPR